MKLFVFSCLVVAVSTVGVSAVAWGNPAPVAHHVAPAALSTGTSTSSRTQDAAGNYAFAYNEQHSTGGSSRQESGNGWAAQGSYTLNVGDGRSRVVKYIADGAGFRAAIATNEPGTAALPAASTAISSPFAPPQPVEPLPVPVVAAPAPIAVAAPEPIAQHYIQTPIAEPVAAVPAVSSYSTSINHVQPAPVAVHVAAPAIPAIPALPAPIPVAHVAAPAPIPAIPALPVAHHVAPLIPAAPIRQIRYGVKGGWN